MVLKVLCNGILKLMGFQVTTEISGYKDIEWCMVEGVVSLRWGTSAAMQWSQKAKSKNKKNKSKQIKQE